MNIVPASQILRAVWASWNGTEFDADAPGLADYRNLRTWLSGRLREAWQSAPWHDLILFEKRYFADLYNRGPLEDEYGRWLRDDDGDWIVMDQVYDEGAIVYYPPTGKYYQCLRDDTTAQAPADANGDVNSAYWVECGLSTDGVEDWETATDYVAGDIVRNIEDDCYYACHTAHTSVGSIDYTKFAEIVDFLRAIPNPQFLRNDIGTVYGVWNKDPRRFGDAYKIEYQATDSKIVILENVTSVWLKFRLPPPDLIGDAYSAVAAYDQDEQVYFTGVDGTGDFWTCLKDTTAGQSPTTHSGKWVKEQIPAMFERFLIHAVTSDAMRSEQSVAMADVEIEAAYDALCAAQLGQFPSEDVRPQVYTR
jgi:hypothetical protein